SILRRAHRIGLAILREIRNELPKPFVKPARSPKTMENDWRQKARSAGARCIAGNGWSNYSKWSIDLKHWDFRPIWLIHFCSRLAITPLKIDCCRRTLTGHKRTFSWKHFER